MSFVARESELVSNELKSEEGPDIALDSITTMRAHWGAAVRAYRATASAGYATEQRAVTAGRARRKRWWPFVHNIAGRKNGRRRVLWHCVRSFSRAASDHL